MADKELAAVLLQKLESVPDGRTETGKAGHLPRTARLQVHAAGGTYPWYRQSGFQLLTRM